MRVRYGIIACSLLLCSFLTGCSQVKDAVKAVLDDDTEEVTVVQSEDAGDYGNNTAGINMDNGSTDVFVDDVNSEPMQQNATNMAANGGAGSSFSLIDQTTNMAVESYQLPAGWQGTGQVLRPPMQSIYWQSYFMHPQAGSVGFRFFTVSSNGIGPYRNSQLLQNDYLAYSILQDVQKYMNMPLQNAKVVSSGYSPHDTPENQQIIQFMKQHGNTSGFKTNYAPLQYHAVANMTCNGQPYTADIICNLLCWEKMNSRVAVHNVTVQNSYGVVAPAAQLQQEQKTVLGILASRSENQQWVQYGLQYNNQQAQQSNAHYDNMNRIIQDKNNHINSVQQQMNQNTADTMDRVRQGQHEMITETSDVANPYNPGTTITTDNNYDHGWTNSQGQVINTDSVLYNPNEDRNLNDVDWTQIK